LYWELDAENFTRVSWKTHRGLADNIKDYFKGDPSSLDYLRAMGDFIYAEVDPPLERFQHLLLAAGNGVGVSFSSDSFSLLLQARSIPTLAIMILKDSSSNKIQPASRESFKRYAARPLTPRAS